MGFGPTVLIIHDNSLNFTLFVYALDRDLLAVYVAALDGITS